MTKVEEAARWAIDYLKKVAPKDTGHLAYDSIKIEKIDVGYSIYVDETFGTGAKYMPYTNEPWTSPRWKGKQNPNEKWWENACKFIIDHIALFLNGELKEL